MTATHEGTEERVSKVGLLGTKFTMEMDFYKNGLESEGHRMVDTGIARNARLYPTNGEGGTWRGEY